MSADNNDPFALLENAAKRQQAEEVAAKAVSEARSSLVLDRTAKGAFFATLAMSLKPVADWNMDTAATDGKVLVYNPYFIVGLNLDQRIGLMAHEVMHLANKHHTRQEHRDAKMWNIAADLGINGIILDAGFKLPSEGCVPEKGQFKDMPKGLSTEDYYTRLPNRKQGEQPSGEGEGDDPGRCGGVKPAGDGSEAAARESEAEWNVKVIQAGEAARKRGELPAGIDRMIGAIKNPKVDWKAVLREFVTVMAKNDYSWFPPNRRFVHMGLYLPGMRSEEMGDIVVAVDTSGSIDTETLSMFASEMQGILDSYDCTLKIIYHDSEVAGEQTWKSTDGPLILTPAGGGGTDHRPVFDHIEEKNLEPTCLVLLTDLCSTFPAKAPGYPVLWCSTVESAKGPFGRTVHVG